jgi:hypothetical protein
MEVNMIHTEESISVFHDITLYSNQEFIFYIVFVLF